MLKLNHGSIDFVLEKLVVVLLSLSRFSLKNRLEKLLKYYADLTFRLSLNERIKRNSVFLIRTIRRTSLSGSVSCCDSFSAMKTYSISEDTYMLKV